MKPETKQHNLRKKNLGQGQYPSKVDRVSSVKTKAYRVTPSQPLGGHHSKTNNGFDLKLEMLNNTLPVLFPTIPMSRIHKDLQYIAHLYSYKGAEYTLRYLKASAESVEAILLNLEHQDLKHEKVSIGKYYNGWPKWLGKRLQSGSQTNEIHSSTSTTFRGGLKSNQRINGSHLKGTHYTDGLKSGQINDNTFMRYVNTLCSIRRFITIPTKTKLDSITRPISRTVGTKPFNSIIERIGKHFRDSEVASIRAPIIGSEAKDIRGAGITTYTMPKLQISMKKTPNGVGFYSFHWDRAAVMRHNIVPKVTNFAHSYFTGEVDGFITERLEPYKPLIQDGKEIHVG